MNKMKRLLALLLCAVLLSLAACQTEPAPTEPTETEPTVTEPPEPTAQELYDQAVAALTGGESIKLKAEITRTTTVGSDVYTKTSQQQFTWKNRGKEDMEAKVIENITIGEDTEHYTEVYRDGAVYLTYDNLAYVSDMTEADFEARWLSVIPLDMALYETVSKEDNSDGKLLRFDGAAGLETWAAPEYARLNAASGTAQLNTEGKLTGFTYTASFTQGGAGVELTAQIEVLENDVLDLTLSIPSDDDRYVYIGSPDIPRILMDAYGYLGQFGSVTATGTQFISSEALSAACDIVVSLAASGTGDEHISNIQQMVTVEIYNGDRLSDSATYTWDERFENGVYTMVEDGGNPEQDGSITAESMYDYCFSILAGNYPPLNEITGATLTDFGGICLVELDCSVELAQAYSRSLCDYLTSDSSLLDRLASSYKTTAMDYYVAINLDTGLPTACGINFSGTHTIEDVPYSMSYRSNQTIYVADPDTSEILTGEKSPEEPTKKATPVFYHVTGAEGQEMWLMGTIHLGDERTGYLPQEIYSALESSSALAVEFDDEAFYQMLAEDEELAARVVSSYIYLDGTSAADHLDPAVYAAAAKLLKAAGTGSTDLMLLKPFLWSQIIEGFYLQQGYNLQSDKGLDMRLMEYAREKEIEILNVESGIEQLEMLSSFSDAIQEMMLVSSIDTPCAEMVYGVEDIYELWCSGDEAALIEYLKDDTSDMTKQEEALYKEYNKAMSTDRNAEMLLVAKDYLESGDVVFYAVGLAHLLAEDGLVNTLREAGYTVDLIEYAE